MGCFLGCFGAAKDRKRRKQRHKIQPRDHLQRTPRNNLEPSIVSLAQDLREKPTTPVKESSGKPEEPLSSASKKKVTFDTNVKTYEHVWPDESIDFSLEQEEEEEEEEETSKNREDLVKPTVSQYCSDDNNSVTSSSGSYPPNHRYQNCRESDDEEDELDNEESELEDEDDGMLDDQDDDGYYEDMICRVKRVYTEEIEEEEEGLKGMKEMGRNGGARDRSGYVHSVLNPVENLTQWKAVKEKGKGPPPLKPQKENLSLDEETQIPFNLKESSRSDHHQHQPKKSSLQEVAVDASLSTWLSSSETTPMSKNSSINFKPSTPGSNSIRSQEDRPILGALTLEEIRQFSASSVSPKRSPSKSPDETPIIGTVGTYWNHTVSSTMDPSSASAASFKGIPNTTSKYREDRRVNWHSTPFETRLERALERGAAAASSNAC
ncbi:DNA ligase 1 [Carica papaya]|uniref:DNA ligase 1 n=1 Tax=Carica papaya TaxID=3649 RepID=UPI000B8CE6FE|nr:DNA ligase 1 [Carica papaya]